MVDFPSGKEKDANPALVHDCFYLKRSSVPISEVISDLFKISSRVPLRTVPLLFVSSELREELRHPLLLSFFFLLFFVKMSSSPAEVGGGVGGDWFELPDWVEAHVSRVRERFEAVSSILY